MANVFLHQSFDFLAPQNWGWTVTEHTASTLSITGGVKTLTATGSFTYSGSDVFGTIETYEFIGTGGTVYTMDGLSLDAHVVQGFIDASGDTRSTYAYVFSGNDSIYGSNGADVLLGYAGDDELHGGYGDDTLFGRADNDYLNGGLGQDIMNGGGGHDTFAFNSRIAGGDNIDTIIHFVQGEDSIELWNGAGVPFKNLGTFGPLDAGLFKANSGGNAADGNDRILYDTDTGALYYDADGSGAGAKVQFALIGVYSHAALTAADFSVVYIAPV